MGISSTWWRRVIVVIGGIIVWEISGIVGQVVATIIAGTDGEILGNLLPLVALAFTKAILLLVGIQAIWRVVNGNLTSVGVNIQNWRQDAIYGVVCAVLIFLLQLFIILPLTGGGAREDVIESAQIMGNSIPGLIAAIIVGWVMGGIAEEVFFRGHLLRSLAHLVGYQRWSIAIASAISVLYFAIGHSYQGVPGMLNAGGLAIIYTALFLWRGTLITSIVIHGVYNTLAFLAIYFIILPGN